MKEKATLEIRHKKTEEHKTRGRNGREKERKWRIRERENENF